jgi:tRNA(fMet)-specific endonuclease VapC
VPHLFDTDILSLLMRPRPVPAAVRRLAELPQDEIFTSAITLSELIYGAERKGTRDLHERIERIVERLVVLPFDERAARIYGPLKADLQRKATPLDEPDLRIASTALANGLTLITGNVRHFDRVPGLTIENWLVES